MSGQYVAIKKIRIHLPVDKDVDMMDEFNKCRFRREITTAMLVNSLYCIRYQDFWIELLDKNDIKEEKEHFQTIKDQLEKNLTLSEIDSAIEEYHSSLMTIDAYLRENKTCLSLNMYVKMELWEDPPLNYVLD